MVDVIMLLSNTYYETDEKFNVMNVVFYGATGLYRYLLLLIPIFMLASCVDVSVTRIVQPITEVNQTDHQFMQAANVTGWISFADYVPAYNSMLTVTLYMQYEGQLLLVGEQIYKNTRLPVRYSFAVAPIQAGQGAMKITTKLQVGSQYKATASADYLYQLGTSKLDLVLKPYQKN
ncbi:YscW family type III secretion system pilotin [Shewanella sp. VB17]|uniref:YscW family type III secretion system pilotin n=1 Tax=Shewanella sp. VB17 TaxID=2739432 RepID=UPI0015678F59|nr:YscW family type III secretion system pilotin [Shewanella sp. VB17]NRD71741.1 YscW family type III secretion system pilotin [Shewanella sp. VB17]